MDGNVKEHNVDEIVHPTIATWATMLDDIAKNYRKIETHRTRHLLLEIN